MFDFCVRSIRRWLKAAAFARNSKKRSFRPDFDILEEKIVPTGNWTQITNVPDVLGTMLLLPNGGVMAQDAGGSGVTNQWYLLTPSSSGSYLDGAWTDLASMNTPRLYYGSVVMPDGNVMVYGGEYSGSSGSLTDNSSGEIYDPATNHWTNIASIPISLDPTNEFGDNNLEVLPDGNVLAGYLNGPQTFIYNPTTNSWSAGPTKLFNDAGDEESWVKLPGNKIVTYDLNAGGAQYLNPATNQWVATGPVPAGRLTNSWEQEIGPGVLLPNGNAFFVGANASNTALYDPSTNTWTQGPKIPGGKISDDAPGAVLPDGNVIFTADSSTPSATYSKPTFVDEYNPVANTITQLPTPPVLTAELNSQPAYVDRMLVLPNGQLAMVDGYDDLWIYSETGTVNSAWQPTITDIAGSGNGFTMTGTQLNGMSEGAAYGDDAQMSENYPIVSYTSATGIVSYATTSNWSSVDVQTGATPVTADFTAPASAGPYLLTVSAAGISSTVLFIDMGDGANDVTLQLDASNADNVQVIENGTTLLGEFPLSSFSSIFVNGAGSFNVNNGNGAITTTIVNNSTSVPATQLAFTTQPAANEIASTPFTTVVQVEGAGGAYVPQEGVNVTLTLSSGTFSNGQTTMSALTDASGQATFSVSVDDAGSYTLSASADSLTGATSTAFTEGPAAVFSTEPPATISAGTPFITVVQLTDATGNAIAQAGVSVTITLSSGTFSTGLSTMTTTTDDSGQATFSATINTAGTYTLDASSSGLADSISTPLVITVVNPLSITGPPSPQSFTEGSPASFVLGSFADTDSNATSWTVDINWGDGSADTHFSTASTTLPNRAHTYNTAGPYTITVTVSDGDGNTDQASFQATGQSGLGTLSFVTQPMNVVAGSNIGSIQVLALDHSGNPIKNATIAIVAAGATLFGTATAQTNSSGIATFSQLVVRAAGMFQLTAVDVDDTLAKSSNPFTIQPAAAASITYVSQPPSSVTAGNPINNVVVQVLDRFGNPVGAGANVTLALASAKLTSGNVTLATDASGQVTFSGMFEGIVGKYHFTVSAPGIAAAASSPFTVTAGNPGKVIFVTQPSNVVAGKTMAAFTVQILDSFGNVVPTAGLGVSVTDSGGTTAGPYLTNSSGRATINTFIETTAGSYTLTVSYSSVVSVPSRSFKVTPGPAVLSFVTSLNQSYSAGSTLPTVTVLAQDAFGNPIQNLAISMHLSGSAALNAGTGPVLTGANGLAVFSKMTKTKVGTYALIASASNVQSVTSSSQFTIIASVPQKVTYVAQPIGTTAGSQLVPVVVEVLDQYGNPVSGVTINVSSSSGDLTGTMSLVTGATGEATFDDLAEPVSGVFAMTATVGSVAPVKSRSYTIKP